MQNQIIKTKSSLMNFQTTNVLAKADLLKLKGGSDIIVEEDVAI